MTQKPYYVRIEAGMLFDNPDDKSTWVVKEEGNYIIENGIRIPIDNCRQNKWWIQKLDSNDPPTLCCFDPVPYLKHFNFRHPTMTK